MADWFETRFRESLDAGRLDPQFAARVRTLVIEEWKADAEPIVSGGTDAGDAEGDIIVLDTRDPKIQPEPPAPRHRPRGRWLLVAAAVVVVVGAGALLAADDDQEIDTAGSGTIPVSATDVMTVGEFVPLEPGTYVIDPDGDETTPLRVAFEIADEGWDSWLGAVKFAEDSHVALSITTVDNVVESACGGKAPTEPPIGSSVDDLVAALTALEPFEVTEAPSDVTIGGYEGTHLQLTVPELPTIGSGDNRQFLRCSEGHLHSWMAKNADGAFFGYNGEPGMTEDYWILDVDGTRLALITMYSPVARAQDVAELEAIFDSIRIVP